MNYLAYTIGPIYETILDTLNDDNKTKKLKAGSYFFSYFMKRLLEKVKDEFDVLVPYIDEFDFTKEQSMGLFHDRFIATSLKNREEIETVFLEKVNIVFEELTHEIKRAETETLKANMDNHYIIANDEELKVMDENVIFALNKILDAKELQRSFTFDIEKNYIQAYQEEQIEKSKVKTLENIAGELNYYAVITADGDKMGAKIKEEATQNPQNIKHVSKKLFEFFTEDEDVYQLTNETFGGELIYAGGDDILAFLPVKYEDKSFLDYIALLDERFKEKVGHDVSLSFGVNIAYYKYPLRDAIQSAFDLLYEAKSNKSNSITLKITKHSGQWFGSTLQLGSQQYTAYRKLLEGVLNKEIELPHSIHHTLKRYEIPLMATFDERNSASIDAMFEVVFNDEKDEKTKEGLNQLKELLKSYQPRSEEDFNRIFSLLSVVKFLREDRK